MASEAPLGTSLYLCLISLEVSKFLQRQSLISNLNKQTKEQTTAKALQQEKQNLTRERKSEASFTGDSKVRLAAAVWRTSQKGKSQSVMNRKKGRIKEPERGKTSSCRRGEKPCQRCLG